MDRNAVVKMAEEYWRNVLPAMGRQDMLQVEAIVGNFEARICEIASRLTASERAAFERLMEFERKRLLNEYREDRAAFKQRMGFGIRQPKWRKAEFYDPSLHPMMRPTASDHIRALLHKLGVMNPLLAVSNFRTTQYCIFDTLTERSGKIRATSDETPRRDLESKQPS